MRMNALRVHYSALKALAALAVIVWLMLPSSAAWAQEDRFAVLQTRTVAYTNVTVTTKAKNYIFILHAGGMTSLKVAELPMEIQQQLGYGLAESKGSTNRAAAWASREMAKLGMPEAKVLKSQLKQTWSSRESALASMARIGPKLILAVSGVMLLLHLFYSYCCLLICRKTGKPPGILVWVPVLQLIPMLRAAGMSGWWFLAYFVPLLNLVPTILWPLKIAKARGKSVWVGVLLLLPITNVFAFLYLAFSDSVADKDDERPEPNIMTLQTA